MTIGVVVPAEPDEKDVHECAIEALVNVADSHLSLNPVPYGRESASLSWVRIRILNALVVSYPTH